MLIMKKLLLFVFTIFFLSMPFFAFSQTRQISGIVSDESKLPLSFVSVVQKGTAAGTTTNEKGEFTIAVSGANPVLVFSHIDREPQEVAIGSSNTYNVSLVTKGSLTEVVVTALGIKRSERAVGYSTQQVKGENLTFTKEQNVIGSLAGKIAGVQVVGASGAAMGGTQKIKIRGVNSLNGNDQALIVVDGTPISNSNFGSSNGNGPDLGNIAQDINPDDVESVSVLKGPAASALYGLRGQYGVILITTRKGKKGPKKIDVQYSSAFSMEKVGNFLPLQNLYGVGNDQAFQTLANGD
jgi:TonB-dependent SusC/RagA subfamily outer membrane receptor